jgi:hypothetical protein
MSRQGVPQKGKAGVNYERALEILRPLAAENRLTNGGPEDMDFSTRGSNEGYNW